MMMRSERRRRRRERDEEPGGAARGAVGPGRRSRYRGGGRRRGEVVLRVDSVQDRAVLAVVRRLTIAPDATRTPLHFPSPCHLDRTAE